SEPFNLPNSESASSSALSVAHSELAICDREQSAAVSCGEFPFFDPVLNCRLQLQQANGVGNRGAILAGSFRNGFLGQLNLVHQAFKRARSLHRVEILALDVLNQRHLQCKFVGNFADDGSYFCQSCSLSSTPAAFPGDQLIAIANGPYHD